MLPTLNLNDLERLAVTQALDTFPTLPLAASALGITRHSLKRRMAKHGLQRGEPNLIKSKLRQRRIDATLAELRKHPKGLTTPELLGILLQQPLFEGISPNTIKNYLSTLSRDRKAAFNKGIVRPL